jgi:hypothetical protein
VDQNPYAPPQVAASDEPRSEDHACLVSIFCSECGGTVNLGDISCAKCGREVSKDEKRALQRRWEASDREMAKAAEDSYWGRTSIGAAAGLATIQILFSLGASTLAIWGACGAGALWILFGWSFRDGWSACGLSVIVYLLWWFAPLAFAPVAVLDGVLFKVIILTALAGGFAAEANMRRRQRAVTASLRVKRKKTG